MAFEKIGKPPPPIAQITDLPCRMLSLNFVGPCFFKGTPKPYKERFLVIFETITQDSAGHPISITAPKI